MKLKEIIDLIGGQVLTSEVSLERNIKGGFGADLMSDVLASVQEGAVLLTGLCNPQVVRTAQMADIQAIIFVRAKMPPTETITLANQEDIPLICSLYGMFELCGRLYQAGLESLEVPVSDSENCSCE
ncbi:MAG: hypothetical protein JXA13_16320 [Anaerolineales bacterium]|nr:hypothetical protein [Anaerolineales bacterium]